jgi:hypothetical protein
MKNSARIPFAANLPCRRRTQRASCAPSFKSPQPVEDCPAAIRSTASCPGAGSTTLSITQAGGKSRQSGCPEPKTPNASDRRGKHALDLGAPGGRARKLLVQSQGIDGPTWLYSGTTVHERGRCAGWSCGLRKGCPRLDASPSDGCALLSALKGSLGASGAWRLSCSPPRPACANSPGLAPVRESPELNHRISGTGRTSDSGADWLCLSATDFRSVRNRGCC